MFNQHTMESYNTEASDLILINAQLREYRHTETPTNLIECAWLYNQYPLEVCVKYDGWHKSFYEVGMLSPEDSYFQDMARAFREAENWREANPLPVAKVFQPYEWKILERMDQTIQEVLNYLSTLRFVDSVVIDTGLQPDHLKTLALPKAMQTKIYRLPNEMKLLTDLTRTEIHQLLEISQYQIVDGYALPEIVISL